MLRACYAAVKRMLRAAPPLARPQSKGAKSNGANNKESAILLFALCSLLCQGLGVRPEAVADVADGLDEGVVPVFDLGAQAADVDVDGAAAAEEVVPPDLAEEGLAAEDAAAVRGQEAEEFVLLVGELHRAAAARTQAVFPLSISTGMTDSSPL